MNRTKLLILACLLLFMGSKNLQAQSSAPQLGKNSAKEVIAAMTLEEKAKLLVGTGMKMGNAPVVGESANQIVGAAGSTFAIPRLGIPSIVVADGPAGLRIAPIRNNDSTKTYYCTAFPVATLLASSWDTDLVKKVGSAMGNEVLEYGVDVILGPGINIHRNPLGGRNFEYYSEDPYLTGKLTAAMVNGIQSNGVGTSVKHFAGNNQETSRNSINTIIGERALREVYLEGFRIGIQESNPWTVMSSYNKINDVYTSENKDLLTTILRNDWGYKGFVMTDWFGGKDPIAQMKAGNDLLMPGTPAQVKKIMDAVQNGELDIAILDRNVEKMLNIIQQSPSFRKYKYSNNPDLKLHAQVARIAAADGMVLLRNDTKTLPFSNELKKIAAFGNTSYDMVTGGTGSGDVNEAYTVSLVEGLKNAGFSLDEELIDTYSKFIQTEYSKRPKQKGFLLPAPLPQMELTNDMISKKAEESDLALITIGRNSGEFADRKLNDDFYLSAVEKDMIKNVTTSFHAQGKKVVIVLNIGGVIETASWKEMPDAILLAWQPGQEAGNAIADVLSGKVNPSGKIATTFPKDYTDVASSKNFPGTPAEKPAEVVYEEGIYVGYRYFDSFEKAPSYEFGYGLSYTNFTLSNMKLSSAKFKDKISISVDVINTGSAAGKEVVQLYLSAPAKIMEKPVKELKAFAKTNLLKSGEKQTLTFTIDARSLSSYDAGKSAWIAEAGEYKVSLGTSSRDIRQTGTLTLDKELTVKKENKALVPTRSISELKK